MNVKPKKHFGQHFLKDQSICEKIAKSIVLKEDKESVLEIGPGTGALTKFLFTDNIDLKAYELDDEAYHYLINQYPTMSVINRDILIEDWTSIFENKFIVVGNFPYNISSQIVFKVFEHRNQVSQLVGMFQKEVAERICANPGTKKYGILSVLIQAFYNTEYLFTVDEHVFDPPPKVKSGVIQFLRNETEHLTCNEILFVKVVKTVFNQRRKMIRNSIKSLLKDHGLDDDLATKRPEQLGVLDYIRLTNLIESKI